MPPRSKARTGNSKSPNVCSIHTGAAIYGFVAQSAEQLAVNQWVVGSSPTETAKEPRMFCYASLLHNIIFHMRSYYGSIV